MISINFFSSIIAPFCSHFLLNDFPHPDQDRPILRYGFSPVKGKVNDF